MMDWLHIERGDAPVVIAVPHAGTFIPDDLAGLFRSEWLACKDADLYVDRLYGFARKLGVTIIKTDISRSVIDVNRDPSGASLYPGMATTDLCPITSFDGEPLYEREAPNQDEIDRRRANWFTPYHQAIETELTRLKTAHGAVVLYDAHSIRSQVPRLFDGNLPTFNIGTNGGTTCAIELQQAILDVCENSGEPTVVNGRFKGGWTTRHYGAPETGVHAIQMELAMRGYLDEPSSPNAENWPSPFNPARAEPIISTLELVIAASLDFATTPRHGA